MDAVDPEVNVALGREIALAPTHMLVRPGLLEPPAVGGNGNSAWTRRWKDIIECQVSEMGGAANMSEAQISLARRALFTLGISHREDKIAILDAILEVKPPFSYQNVVAEFAAVCKSYGCFEVSGDDYSGGFVKEL